MKPITHKKLYFSILMSLIFIVLLVVLSTSVVFSGMYTKSMYNQLSSEYSYSLERLVDEFNNIFNNAGNMDFTLRQNTDITSFLMNIDKDNLTINRADIFLKQTLYIYPYLRSIILYNSNFEYPLISGYVDIGINQFINEKLRHPDIKSRLNIVISSSTPNGLAGTGTVETLSIIFTDSKNFEEITDHAVIINIDKEEVEKKLLGQYEGITIVADNVGKVIFHSYNYPSEQNINEEPYFKTILSRGEITGSFDLKMDGDNKIVTYRKSLTTDFYLINIRSLNDITKAIIDKMNEIILISLLILLFFGIAGYLISRGIYSPIRKVTDMISGSKYAGSNPKMGEIATISKVFTETLEHLNNLEIKSEGNNSRIKEDLLRSVLKTDSIPDSLENELKEYKPGIEFSNLVLVSVKIDNYSQLGPNDRFAYEKALCKTIPDFLAIEFDSEVVDMFEGEIALLLNYKNKEENSFSIILSVMDDIRAISKKSFKISLTIGIGGVANNIGECASAYKKAVDMVKHRFVLGTDNIYHKKYLEEHLVSNPVYPAEIEEKLVDSIKLNKKETFLENLQNAIDLLSQYPYSEAVSAFFQIATACIKTINQITSQMNNSFYLGFDDMSSIFASLQTLGQAREWLVRIFDEYRQMLEEINQLKSNKHYKMIEKMQDYIKQNYMNINMSVESLADIAGYAPYYFSKIFREITGLNVTDYIRNTRINKAKELLGADDLKINEIPSLIGFTNISHFYSVFKKDVGLTPLAYREYALKDK